MRGSVEERFWDKVSKRSSEECWLWTASTRDGYGCMGVNGVIEGAHRISYELFIGSIPESKVIDHKCRVRLCVNPKHLQLVSRKENIENHSGAYKTSTSKIRGVYWDSKLHKWRASVQHNGKRYNAGSFHSLEKAEAAVIALRNKLFTNNLVDRDAHILGAH